ncbi:hypothetical protein AACH10_12990 [Ideonella sp. DXS22W]|uniref:histidine kinase n=1 Tax=Pseudaquabacterium inlustre TaxID=2984192 RepID=A0ABU9CH25_9BURK
MSAAVDTADTEVQTLWQAERAVGLRDPAQPGAASDWQAVALDEAWRRQQPPIAGLWTYRLHFTASRDSPPLGLLIPRVGDRVRLFVNGRQRLELGAPGQPAGDGEDHSAWPVWLPLEQADLREGENTLHIQVQGNGWRLSGLSHLVVGPRDRVAAQHRRSLTAQLALAGISLSVCAAVALLAGAYALWWPGQRVAGMLALSAAAWGLRSLLWWWPDSGLSQALRLLLLDLGFSAAVALASATALRLAGLPTRRWWLLLGALLALQPLVALWLAHGGPVAGRALAQNALVLVCVGVLLRLAWRARRRGQWPARVVAAGGLAMLALSGHDHWFLFLSTARDAHSQPYLTPLGLPLFLLACGWLLAWRVHRGLRAEALAQRLRDRREQLRRAAAEHERQRLLRQLHDGLGAQLVGLLAAVQRGTLQGPQIADGLRDTLDELRLSLDLMDCDGDDLGELLGQLRFRLEPRLRQAGLALHWQVPVGPALPPPPGMARPGGPDHLRHWLQEALTNVLKHARATRVQVSAGPGWLAVQDDGIGASAPTGMPEQSAAGGRGLRHLGERARALGAVLEVGPAHPGWRVALRWPVHSSHT